MSYIYTLSMETSRTFLVILQDFRKKRQNFVDNPIFNLKMIRFLKNIFLQRVIEMASFLDEYYKCLREYEHVGCSILSFSVIQTCTIHCKVNELLLSEKRHQFILLFRRRMNFASHVTIDRDL
jgi:hypothetical protein